MAKKRKPYQKSEKEKRKDCKNWFQWLEFRDSMKMIKIKIVINGVEIKEEWIELMLSAASSSWTWDRSHTLIFLIFNLFLNSFVWTKSKVPLTVSSPERNKNLGKFDASRPMSFCFSTWWTIFFYINSYLTPFLQGTCFK